MAIAAPGVGPRGRRNRRGALFLERARTALSAAEAAGAKGRDLEAGVVGMVKLGLSAGARWCRTSAVLEQFTRERGGVELTLLEGYGGTLWRDLRDGRLDAILAPSNFASADLRGLRVGAEPWVVLVGRRHRLAGVGPLAAVISMASRSRSQRTATESAMTAP